MLIPTTFPLFATPISKVPLCVLANAPIVSNDSSLNEVLNSIISDSPDAIAQNLYGELPLCHFGHHFWLVAKSCFPLSY